MQNNISDINCVNDRIIKIETKGKPVDLVVIQIYMYTNASTDKEVEETYEKIEELMNEEKGKYNIVVMGHCNAMVGEGKDEKTADNMG